MYRLTQKQLKKIVNYNPNTGIFTALISRGCVKRGSIVGNPQPSGVYCRMLHIQYAAHHLAWLYTYGYLPKRIDHKDRNNKNNRIKNLREANQAQNMKNIGLFRTNKSGFRGVHFHKQSKKWRAQIAPYGDHVGKIISLGLFDTPEEASKVYNDYAKKHWGEFFTEVKGGVSFVD